MLESLNKEYKDKLEEIKNHFGEEAQKAKLLEELEEVEDEIEDYARNHIHYDAVRNPDTNIDRLLDEIVDCYVVAYQVNKTYFIESLLEHISEGYMDDGYKLIKEIKAEREAKLLEIAKFKIDRTLERIKTGYYSKPEKCPECNGKGSIRLPYGRTVTKCKKCDGSGTKEKGVVDNA